MLKINGVQIHEPQEMMVRIQDVDFDSGRTADGTMHRNRVNVKRKIELKFPPMSTQEISKVLKAVDGESFTVTYLDPYDGAEATRTFYSGDREAPVYNFALNIWKSCSFNLIEF